MPSSLWLRHTGHVEQSRRAWQHHHPATPAEAQPSRKPLAFHARELALELGSCPTKTSLIIAAMRGAISNALAYHVHRAQRLGPISFDQ